jgi:hypothetical protein
MSIEQKIAEILAESTKLDEFKVHGKEGGSDSAKGNAVAGDQSPVRKSSNAVPAQSENENEDNKRNNVEDEDDAAEATSKKSNPANSSATDGDQAPVRKGATAVKGVKEDVDALLNGEELSEEFRQKAETIFEAAVLTRVKEELVRIEEEFEAKLAEQVAKNTEGIIEQVDGYLDYIAEQWLEQNEIALENGIKSEILESFVVGMKSLFEEHYIEVPEERFDVLGEMEERINQLEAKLNEEVANNIDLTKQIDASKRAEIVKTVSEGLTDTETEKFLGLVEELSYEDAESFETKVKTIRENYFTKKANTIVESVVTDSPVETLTEEKKVQVDPSMSAYLSVLSKSVK